MNNEYYIELRFKKAYQRQRSPYKYGLDKWLRGHDEWKRLKYCRKKKIQFDGDEKKVEAEAKKCDYYQTVKIHDGYMTYLHQLDLNIPPGEVNLKITAYVPKYLKVDIIDADVIYDEAEEATTSSRLRLKVFEMKLEKNQEEIEIVTQFKNYDPIEATFILRPLKLLPKILKTD